MALHKRNKIIIVSIVALVFTFVGTWAFLVGSGASSAHRNSSYSIQSLQLYFDCLAKEADACLEFDRLVNDGKFLNLLSLDFKCNEKVSEDCLFLQEMCLRSENPRLCGPLSQTFFSQEKLRDKAEKLSDLACARRDTKGCEVRAQIANLKNDHNKVSFYKRACSVGSQWSCSQIAVLDQTLSQDNLNWLLEQCRADIPQACVVLPQANFKEALTILFNICEKPFSQSCDRSCLRQRSASCRFFARLAEKKLDRTNESFIKGFCEDANDRVFRDACHFLDPELQRGLGGFSASP